MKNIHLQLEMHTLMLFYHATTSSSFDAKDSLFKLIYTIVTKGYTDTLLKRLKSFTCAVYAGRLKSMFNTILKLQVMLLQKKVIKPSYLMGMNIPVKVQY